MTRTIDRNSNIQRISETYRKTVQATTEVTRTAGRNRHPSPHRIANQEHHHTRNVTAKRKPNGRYDRSYKPYHTTTLHDNYD